MKSILNWLKGSMGKTLDELIHNGTTITISDIRKINECRAEMAKTAKILLDDPKHSRTGYNILGALATGGEMKAQLLMGEFCETVLERPEQAAIFYQQAADQGSSEAQVKYANMLMTGKGVARNHREAFLRYALAADQGIGVAQFEVGEFYRNGEDIPGDLDKAVYWYKLAKQNGIDRAEIRLMQIMGVIPVKKQSNNYEIALNRAILKLPEDIFCVESSAIDNSASRESYSDFKKIFPVVYIN